jgi:transcriptional regulator with XRE-family HTH domain
MPARPRRRDLREAFGEAVRQLRIGAGLSQEGLSFRAKVNRTYIGELERGEKSPTLDVIDAVAAALAVTPERLVGLASQRRNHAAVAARVTTRARQRVRRSPAPRPRK